MASVLEKSEVTVRSKLSILRRLCDEKIEAHQQKIDSVSVSLKKFLQSHKSNSESSAQNQVKLGKLKVELRELEDELVRALSVKTRKEAKRIEITDSLSEARVKVGELQKIVRDQATSKDEYAAMLSEQSKALADSEERSLEALRRREVIQDTVTWYNKVLGFRINTGQGVTFSFTNINKECPSEEYSFTIRYANEIYTLLDCKPHVNGIEELVHELNKSNGLFRFVKIVREKFRVTSLGSISHFIYQDQDCTSMSLSASFSYASPDIRSKSPVPFREVNGDVRNDNHGKGFKSPHLFLSPRRSPRIVAKKQRDG
ncbi:kinetochore protein SPC25 homolog isoform X1 [Amaranthus tricolor]|uniref:kinetochore protein SPC25 homolog isoform X1 n=1 Tax=Amaranthus tricolor TaxID=29722 RepID=UPI00258CD0FF|nr:kinetochore protein SPC25 homolog isoform X1 [Amaranthus tricolor]